MAIDPATGLEVGGDQTFQNNGTVTPLGNTVTQDDTATTDPVGVLNSDPNVAERSTMAGQLSALLNTNSPLMKQAESKAKERANRQGLLSSSLAVGAGQRAVIEAASPIASQDALTNAQSQLATQQGEIESTLLTQEASQALTQVEREAELTGDLEKAARAWQADFATQENQWSEDRLASTQQHEFDVLDKADTLSTSERQDKHDKALEILNATQTGALEHTTLQGAINGFIQSSALDQASGVAYADTIMKIMTLPESEADAAVKADMTTKAQTMYAEISDFSTTVWETIFGKANPTGGE